MQPTVLRMLEFDRIVDAVCELAVTPMGRDRLTQLEPSTDRSTVADWQARTSETLTFLTRYGLLPLVSTSELPHILDSLAIEGRPLEGSELLTLAAFLESVDETRVSIRRVAASFPLLDHASAAGASFTGEVRQIRDQVDSTGTVADHASAALKMIRERLRKQRTRLRSSLESYLRGKETAKYLQDQVVTERNGRYVLVVKTEHRSGIPGIVHGASTSGASLFLEPLSTVEINNDIVALEEQEIAEVRRILLLLTDLFRARAGDLQRTIDAAVELDGRQAKARFSRSLDGIEPSLSTDGAFELLAARHPLLKAAVPVTIQLVPPATALLITGPNTGGKTVALKTAGLLAVMAQAGLHIPAVSGSRLPVFQSVFADIGDEQSIEASLSTFSGHVSNLVSMDRSLAMPALILLDEVGSGTDPVEGGALGVAVVDHFRRRGATVIATSHYDALKTYASTTDGVVSAAFGFDAQTFAPTYQLLYGSPGRSLALEIATRLGMSPSIIEAARRNLSAREAQLAEHLAKIDRDLRALEHEQRLVARERESLETADQRMRQREEALKEKERTARKRLDEELETQVRAARREIDQVIADLKARAGAMERAGASAITTGNAGAARSEAKAAVDAVAQRVAQPVEPPDDRRTESIEQPAAIGDRVVLGGLGLQGIVTGIHDGFADLDIRGKRMRASLRDLRVVTSGPERAPQVKVNLELAPRETSPADLNVIGCRVDEALTKVERFLDESLLGENRVVHLIHGYGTGQLKRALAGFLQQHPLVARFASAPPELGGGGVTVVELKD
jgi:DNA mismatch repair protein MutS2